MRMGSRRNHNYFRTNHIIYLNTHIKRRQPKYLAELILLMKLQPCQVDLVELNWNYHEQPHRTIFLKPHILHESLQKKKRTPKSENIKRRQFQPFPPFRNGRTKFNLRRKNMQCSTNLIIPVSHTFFFMVTVLKPATLWL